MFFTHLEIYDIATDDFEAIPVENIVSAERTEGKNFNYFDFSLSDGRKVTAIILSDEEITFIRGEFINPT